MEAVRCNPMEFSLKTAPFRLCRNILVRVCNYLVKGLLRYDIRWEMLDRTA